MSGRLSQHEKEKGTYFCLVTNDLQCRNNIKEICHDFPVWSWIDHEPDDEEGKPHTHFLLRNTGTRSVKQMADRLDIPSNYVQVCRKLVAFRRYMVHADNPEKKQYSIDDVHTNHKADFKIALEGQEDKDIFTLQRDYHRLATGKITVKQFIEENYNEMAKMSFQSKIKMLDTLYKVYGSACATT